MRIDQIKNIPQESATSALTTVTEARLNLKKLGEPVDSRMEAIRRFSAGDRIFAVHEQDDDPIEIQSLDELENFTPDQLLAVSSAAMAEASDISGLVHAARHYNRSFIVTARTAEGSTRRYRVRAQSERTAREQFSRHHNQAEILAVREENLDETDISENAAEPTTFKVIYYSPKTDRNVTKTIKADSESAVWDQLKAKGLDVVSVEHKVCSARDLAEAQGAEGLEIGDDVIITGPVQFQGSTGVIEQFGRDKRFVVVNLYNQGRRSFHSSDVSFNEYADSDAEEARMYDSDPEFRKQGVESELKEGRRLKTVVRGDNPDVYAKVYWDTDWEEFQVRLFVNGKYAGEDSDYHASDLDDAMSTAQDMVRRAGSGVTEGSVLKSIKRGMQGWDKNAVGPGGEKLGDPKDIVKRNKAYDTDTAKKIRAGLDDASAHSPAGLQKRVLDRKSKCVTEVSFTAAAAMHAATRKQSGGKTAQPTHGIKVGDEVTTADGKKGQVHFVQGDTVHVKGTNPYFPDKIKHYSASDLKKGMTEAAVGQSIDYTSWSQKSPEDQARLLKDYPKLKITDKPSEPRATPTRSKKLTLGDVWRKVETVVSQVYPDGDPIDWLSPWLNKHGIKDFKVGEVLDRAARKNGYKDLYDYYHSMGELYPNKQGVAEGLEDMSTQQAITDTVERLFRKNQISDYDSLEAVRQGVKHHFSKPGATAESAIDGILNILTKRMRKSGNYVDLNRFREALRQGVAHQLKKSGVAEGYWEDAVKKAEAERQARRGKPFELNPASHDKDGVYKGDRDLAGNPVPREKQGRDHKVLKK